MGLTLLRKQPQKLAVIRQYLVTIVASLPFAVAGAAVAWPSPTLPRILSGETSVPLDITEISWIVSLLYLGEAAGALPSVYLSDKIGRKKTLLYSGVFPIVSWSMLLTSDSAITLYVARFLAGLQMGITAVVYPLYVSEVSQTDIRPFLTGFRDITFNTGIFFVSLVGPFVSSEVLVTLILLLSTSFLVFFQFSPESPHFMLSRNEIPKARKSLLWLRGDLNRIELEFELDRIEKLIKIESQENNIIRGVFTSNVFRKHVIVVLLLSAIESLPGVNVILAFATVTFPKISFGILTPNDCMIILSSATFVFSFIATYVSEIFHGKKLVVFSYCGCCVAISVVTIWFYLSSKTKVNVTSLDFVPFLGCLLYLVFCSFCHSANLMLINIPRTSLNLKTNLSVLSAVVKATICFALNKTYLEFAHSKGIYVNFLIYSLGCFLAASFYIVFWVSVVDDRTAQDDQNSSTADEYSKSSLSSVNGSF